MADGWKTALIGVAGTALGAIIGAGSTLLQQDALLSHQAAENKQRLEHERRLHLIDARRDIYSRAAGAVVRIGSTLGGETRGDVWAEALGALHDLEGQIGLVSTDTVREQFTAMKTAASTFMLAVAKAETRDDMTSAQVVLRQVRQRFESAAREELGAR